jgi:cob(I)alamin adenosyltransferase
VAITTGFGDGGFTELPASIESGGKVPKTDPRIEFLGSLDELSAFMADASLALRVPEDKLAMNDALKALPIVMSFIAMPPDAGTDARLNESLKQMEADIARLEEKLELTDFVGPAQNEAAAKCDIARTVCRRAERRFWAACSAKVAGVLLNRLSDLLYILARNEEKELSSRRGAENAEEKR